MRILKTLALSSAAIAVFDVAASAQQTTDLQPGRNYPQSQVAFGQGRSENVDIGDADNDGDYDVIIANGGDGTAQANRIYINNGGVQGGTPGSWSDQTNARFIGVPNDTSRDIEFVDSDGDCDLDIYVSNRGTTANGGEVSRFYVNQGGRQAGNVGFYQEDTDGFWGNLISVANSAKVGTQGSWKDFSCDCDFGDLDLDGDVDLFHSSYGPNINGTADSRLFLNDGTGVFDELWPWANAGADIRLHTLDIDLVDLDNDWDLDVFASSRDSQPRVYRNNLNVSAQSWGGTPYTDITQSALLNQGTVLTGTSNYEAEYGDLDGDGDFDIWAKNYNGFTDRILRNNGNLTFTQMNSWITGDNSVDENEVDFLDYDSDGDLDAFLANFSGTNSLYTSSLAQGQVRYARNGTANMPWQELPQSGNGSITLDGEAADMDGDGDVDLLLSNDSNANNRYFRNALGVPDTHAPTVHNLVIQGNKSDGSDTQIRIALRDNANYYVMAYYDVNLIYSVDGGIETRIPMLAYGSQAYEASIPGGISGSINYRVEGSDDHGNSFVSQSVTYTQTSAVPAVTQNIGDGTVGARGKPYHQLTGDFSAGGAVEVSLCDADSSSLAVLFLSIDSNPLPFKGGLLHTIPIVAQLDLATNDGGNLFIPVVWPALPTGVNVYSQFGVADSVNSTGATLSNAVKFTQP